MKARWTATFLALFFLLTDVSPASAFWFFGRRPAEKSVSREDAVVLTFEEAYQLALERSEDVALEIEELNAAQGRFYGAFEVVLPKIDYVITRSEQDAPKDISSSDSTTSTALRRTTPQQKVVFSQPIFSGFKEIAALQGAGLEKAQRRHEIQRAKELLLVDVAEAFYTLIQVRRNTEILREVARVTGERSTELGERARLGRSRDSEVHSALSDKLIIEADLAEAERLEAVSRQLLEFYIGRSLAAGESLEDADITEDPLADVGSYRVKADARADVQAAKHAKLLAEKKVTVAQAGLFPEVTLDGNYYTQRVGTQKDVDWDVLVTAEIPLFNRLDTFSDIKLAVADKDSARFTYEKTRRVAVLEIQNAHEDYVYSRIIESRLSAAAGAAKKEYQMYAEEYKLNLVNNLDVLDVLRGSREIEQRHNAARYAMKKNYWKLKAAIGETGVVERASGIAE